MLRKTYESAPIFRAFVLASMRPQRNAAENEGMTPAEAAAALLQ